MKPFTRFEDIEVGTEFYLAQTYAYGGRKPLIKTSDTQAVYNTYDGITVSVPAKRLIIVVTK